MHNQKFNLDHPRTAGWMVFVILLIVTQLIAAQIFRVERENELVQLEHETQFFKNHLETSLNYSKTATNMLAFLAEKDILKDNFDAVCADIMTGNPFIDALQLVEGNVITRTYPIEGNEEVLLYNLLNDSIHKRESGRARERKQLYFEGPFKLIQGGTGIVGRLPIFKDGVFWGFSAVIIRTETLMSAFGLDESGENERYYFQLAKSNPIDSASSKLF
ncbi:MAG TPA: CHASE domain-containing protein, partial [Cryomorphaceae bacterium]|nr:CHASE domain-containing protein [Cryomorphaceae bacterium]